MPSETIHADYEALYHQAFEQFGVMALWSTRHIPHPTPEEALVMTRSLRTEGNLHARQLAEDIEQACGLTRN
jgi:hypothetical protein